MKQSKKKQDNDNKVVFGIILIAAVVFGAMKYPYIVIPAILIIGTLAILLWLKKRKSQANTDTMKVSQPKPLTKEEKFTAEYKHQLKIKAENEFLKEQLKLNGKKDLKDFKDEELIKELVERGKIDHGI